MAKLMIDGELTVYKTCCAVERPYKDPDWRGDRPQEPMAPTSIVVDTVLSHFASIAEEAGVSKDDWCVAKGSANNYRKLIDTDYKSNRGTVWRPTRLSEVWRDVKRKVETVEHNWLEADDVLAIHVTNGGLGATIDKDLLQVAGDWLRYKTDHQESKRFTVTYLGDLEYVKGKGIKGTGTRWLAAQMLLGDSTDGFDHLCKRVPKVYKSGKKAGQPYEARVGFTPKQVYELLRESQSPVYEAKALAVREYPERLFNLNAHMAYMLRELPDSNNTISLFDGSRFQLPIEEDKFKI